MITQNTGIAQRLQEWTSSEFYDDQTKADLAAISDKREIEDRFYRDLAFGTGGMRGVMGAGTNRMNEYVVRKATCGLSKYLLSQPESGATEKGVAIAYDTRLHSSEYARAAALTLCAMGIPAYLFDAPMPTPVLSFAVRRLSCAAGIVITASHNPKEYNGYKVYDANGCQIIPGIVNELIRFVNETEITQTRLADEAEAKRTNLLRAVKNTLLNEYLDAVQTQAHELENSARQALRVVYTPLHGTGRIPVCEALRANGFDLTLVSEQAEPDGNFTTVKSPNPEDPEALALGIAKAQRAGADIVLGTDPDCDRVGVAIRQKDAFTLLSGNQIGALLVNYVILRRADRLDAKDTIVKTIVTSELGARIAQTKGLRTVDTLTGFKYIGEQVCQYEASGEYRFLMGYEESYGYLIGTHARDKDAVVSSMLICEMAAYYKAQGKTLWDVLQNLYAEYGFYLDALDSFTLKGKDGSERIQALMQAFRRDGIPVSSDRQTQTLDYSKGIGGLPAEDVVKFTYSSGSWIAVRPSGTEPKLKVYYSMRGIDQDSAIIALEQARKVVCKTVDA